MLKTFRHLAVLGTFFKKYLNTLLCGSVYT